VKFMTEIIIKQEAPGQCAVYMGGRQGSCPKIAHQMGVSRLEHQKGWAENTSQLLTHGAECG
jgi:hypothetical protein